MAFRMETLLPPDMSVPSPTLIPASIRRRMSQKPELRFVFDAGQWAIDVFDELRTDTSSSVK